MGLDITHYKATLNLPENSELIHIGGENRGTLGVETIESFSGFNVPFSHFNKYIQLIDYRIVVDTIIIVDDKGKVENVTDHFSNSDYKILLSNDDLKHNLNDYEIEKDLQKYEKHYGSSIMNEWKVLTYYKIERKKGFYYQEVGYQRKGMNENFWKQFCNNDIYNFALKDDFEYASKCVQKKQLFELKGDFELRNESFKTQFLDEYEYGASFMSLSY